MKSFIRNFMNPIHFLLMLLCFYNFSNAMESEKQNSLMLKSQIPHDIIDNGYENGALIDEELKVSPIYSVQPFIFMNNMFGYLTIKEVNELQKVSNFFMQLVRKMIKPEDKGMIRFNSNGLEDQNVDSILSKTDMKYFWKESIQNLHDISRFFNIKLDKFFNRIPQNIKSELDAKEGRKIRMVLPTFHTFTGLLKNGDVATWGFEHGGTIPLEIQEELNISQNGGKNIFHTNWTFAALLDDGNVLWWGDSRGFDNIPKEKREILEKNVRMLFSTNGAYAILLKDSSVVACGDENVGGYFSKEIEERLKGNVRMIKSTHGAFAALLKDGSLVAWGNKNFGGHISEDIQNKLGNNARMIYSTKGAFAALLSNATTIVWGDESVGGYIPDEIQKKLNGKEIAKIISDERSFTAICVDGEEIQWGNYERKN